MEEKSAGKIFWQEWSNTLFDTAQVEDKPIFLYLKASWCQWCCQMERENFADPDIAYLINKDFIPLRVDSDERPDLNLRYNMGGWPTLAVLTPDGEVVTGATFLKTEDLKKLLAHCLFLYETKKEEIQSRLRQSREKHYRRESREKTAISFEILPQSLEFLKADFDPVYGGFGREPKFPHYEAIELSLLAFHLYRDPAMEQILTTTLMGMSEGELFDRAEGGFFRYAQKRDWSAPHYEKILSDNAWLLRNYLSAYLLTGRKSYKNTAQSIFRYLDTHLYDPDRDAFWGSQRADKQYYSLSLAERSFFPSPSYGKIIYTDANALTVSAYLKAGVLLNEKICLERAQKTINFLWQHCHTKDLGMLHAATLPLSTPWRLLADQVYMARALLDAYQLFGDHGYLSSATLLAQFLRSHFYDENTGGFWDRMDNGKPVGRLKERIKPIMDNSLAAEFFFKLGVLNQDTEYFDLARHTLNFFGHDFPRYGIFASYYAMSTYLLLQPSVLVVILGRKEDRPTQQFLQRVFALYEPRTIIKLLDLDQHPEMAHLLEQRGHSAPRGYLYTGQECLLETDDIEELTQKINNFSLNTSFKQDVE